MKEDPAAHSSSSYRPDIDGLRAMSVLAVVAFHAFPEWCKGGFIGVDVFFVISGYLISTIILRNLGSGDFSFTEFYMRRVRRIFPALALVLAASFAFGWFVLSGPEYKQLGKHIAAAAGFSSNIVLWNEAGYFDNSGEVKPLLHLWSLGIEEQFYILWPALLWTAWKRNISSLAIILPMTAISFFMNVYGVKQDSTATFYSPHTRFWELSCGALLAWALLSEKASLINLKFKLENFLGNFLSSGKNIKGFGYLRHVSSLLGVALLIFGFLKIDKDFYFPGVWALFPVTGAMLIIGSGSRAFVNRSILSNRLAVWLGLISYPLYLWHWPILSFARIIKGEPPDANVRFALVLVAVALSVVTYLLVERPIRSGRCNQFITPGLVALMCAIGYMGYNSYTRNGLLFRFPKIVQEVSRYHFDWQTVYRARGCFLMNEQSYQDFKNCDGLQKSEQETIAIWGDSYAAHLFPGYKLKYGNAYHIAQLTASNCPPVLGINTKYRPTNCDDFNDNILKQIKEKMPSRVILSAFWGDYDDLTNLELTLTELKRIGIKHIDLIGPVPFWNDGLPKQLSLYAQRNFPHVIPARMKLGLNGKYFIQQEKMLRERAEFFGVNYISPLNILCDENGCLTMLDGSIDSLISWDYGHLTTKGSEYLVSKFPDF